MKKLFVSIVAIATVLAFTSCGDDTTAPDITLPTDASTFISDLGDQTAALEGVTAKDKKDGDVTNSLTVSGLDYVGTGSLTYSAKDNANNVGTAQRAVTIKTDKLFGNYLVKENGATSGYNVEAKKSGSDIAKLLITNFGGEGWDAVLQGDGASTVLTIIPFDILAEDGTTGTIAGKVNYQKGSTQYNLISGDYKITWEDGEVESFTLELLLK